MVFNIRGEKIVVTEAIKDYVEKRIGKVSKYLKDETLKANVNVSVTGKDQKIEVTIPIKKIVLRAEESHKDLYTAIDNVSEKLEKQILKNKNKMKHKNNKIHFAEFNIDLEDNSEEENKIVKRKELNLKPMSEEEAMLQIELLGHDFFVYKSAETGNIVVLYKRKDGNYGVIETN